MEMRQMPAVGAKRTSQRVSVKVTPGREILTVLIQVADTDVFPTPMMWCGVIGSSTEKLESLQKMCAEAPESKYIGKSGPWASRDVATEASNMVAESTTLSLPAPHSGVVLSTAQSWYSPRLAVVMAPFISAIAVVAGLHSCLQLYLTPAIQTVPSSSNLISEPEAVTSR